MKDADIDNVYSIETNVHMPPWDKDIFTNCILAGYDCRVLEINTGNSHILGGYIISRPNNTNCHILNCCIAKPLQGKGYGRKLLQTVLYSLEQFTETKAVALEIRASNHIAIHLYESLGFYQKEIKKEYYTDTSGTEDAIFLEKQLRT